MCTLITPNVHLIFFFPLFPLSGHRTVFIWWQDLSRTPARPPCPQSRSLETRRADQFEVLHSGAGSWPAPPAPAVRGGNLHSEIPLYRQLRGLTAAPRLYISFGQRGHMTAANECPRALCAFIWHWQAVRDSNATERKYSLFPLHHPARNGGGAQLVAAAVPSAPD